MSPVTKGADNREGKDSDKSTDPTTVDGIVGIETDALTALNAALGGVDALTAAITLMNHSANDIVAAGNEGKNIIFDYVEKTAKPAIYPTYVQETVQPAIDRYAAEAISRAMKAFAQVQALLDPFLAAFRQGGSS